MNHQTLKSKSSYTLSASILAAAFVLAGTWIYINNTNQSSGGGSASDPAAEQTAALEAKVLPSGGAILPVKWGNLGQQLIEAGVIDRPKFEAVYADRGGLTDQDQKLLNGADDDQLTISYQNSGLLLNLFWALGLGNKNEILSQGPMSDPQYGGAENFASTGGWSLAKGGVMDHYSQHPFINLTPEQQELVARVSKNIYRPCCNNPTHFPDCNHGLAMLGLLELMASQGVAEPEMYKTALQVNAYWFPETYLTIAQYLASSGQAWTTADPQELLGKNYSSGSGYRQILTKTAPAAPKSGGGGCSV